MFTWQDKYPLVSAPMLLLGDVMSRNKINYKGITEVLEVTLVPFRLCIIHFNQPSNGNKLATLTLFAMALIGRANGEKRVAGLAGKKNEPRVSIPLGRVCSPFCCAVRSNCRQIASS